MEMHILRIYRHNQQKLCRFAKEMLFSTVCELCGV